MSRHRLVAIAVAGLLMFPMPSLRGQSVGPDLMVGDLWDSINNYGQVQDITAYAVGSIACNIGDQEVAWVFNTSEHPVQATQLYRLKGGRFEQIGMSWARHGVLALANDSCLSGCIPPDPFTGLTLGVGCSHPSNSNLNGTQTRLGPRGQVNAYTGVFPYHFSQVPYPPTGLEPTNGRRLQAHDADLDPGQNAGAAYFIEIQFITADDAAAGNGTNNVSYREVTVSNPSGTVYDLTLAGTTLQQAPAIQAWQALDRDVVETTVQVPNEGIFILAANTTDLGSGVWNYEYALYNLNSDRAGASFSIPIPIGASVSNIGFHDVDYHSGDGDPNVPGVFSNADWTVASAGGAVTWSTLPYDPVDPQANALKWGTLYNFRFDINVPPASGEVTIELYKPGTPSSVTAATVVPDPLGLNATVPAGSAWSRNALLVLLLAAGAIAVHRRRFDARLPTKTDSP